jgi:hypothetical protein
MALTLLQHAVLRELAGGEPRELRAADPIVWEAIRALAERGLLEVWREGERSYGKITAGGAGRRG